MYGLLYYYLIAVSAEINGEGIAEELLRLLLL